MNLTKQEWRTKLKRERSGLTAQEVAVKSAAIVERLKVVVPWQEIAALHCYEPIRKLNEVDIRPFVEWLQSAHPQVDIYTSHGFGKEWHITELGGDRVDEVPMFDIVVVPMLGFDDSLHRLGYGGGYYDRFLASQPQASKIGVCFELGHLKGFRPESHDIPMDLIVTDTGVYTKKA